MDRRTCICAMKVESKRCPFLPERRDGWRAASRSRPRPKESIAQRPPTWSSPKIETGQFSRSLSSKVMRNGARLLHAFGRVIRQSQFLRTDLQSAVQRRSRPTCSGRNSTETKSTRQRRSVPRRSCASCGRPEHFGEGFGTLYRLSLQQRF